MSFRVRRLGPTDWELLRDMRLRALADVPSAFGSTHAAESSRPPDWWSGSTERLDWFVARHGHACVGLAGLVASAENPTDRHVISMWVEERWRGRGVASALMETLVDRARAVGAASLGLRVAEPNRRARRFYERMGFVALDDREPLASDPSIQTLAMRLDLSAAAPGVAPSAGTATGADQRRP